MSLTDPSDEEKSLTAKQLAVVLALANGKTIVSAAKEVGVNEKTIDRWKHEEMFKQALGQTENDLYQDALNLLKTTARAAIDCLIRNMDPTVSPYVQVQAASKLLDSGIELHKMSELESKLADLEARLEGK